LSDDFDPVAFAIENPPAGSGVRSRFANPKVEGWIESLVKAYEMGQIERWDWVHLSKVLRQGDPTLPKDAAFRDYIISKRPDLHERITQAR
jgi:hypothetical protein